MTDPSTASITLQSPKPDVLSRPGRPKRIVITVVIIAVALAIVIGFLSSGVVDWATVGQYLFSGPILQGLLVTIELTLLSMVIGVVLGVVLALLARSRTSAIAAAGKTYIWFFRGTPVLVQLIFWFNLGLVIPVIGFGNFSIATNALITPFVAAVLGLGLNEGAYMSEIIRAGISSVDRGQSEAGLASGMTPGQVMRKVVLPQALRFIVPPTGNQAIGMLKTTSLVSVIAAQDLLTQAQHIYAQNFRIIELLVVASIWYLVLTSIATYFQSRLERRIGEPMLVAAGRRKKPVVLTQPAGEDHS
jgi:polar amino acid transport system permease protein